MYSSRCYLLAALYHVVFIAWYYTITFEADEMVGGEHFAVIHRRHSFLTNITFAVSLLYFLYYYNQPPR